MNDKKVSFIIIEYHSLNDVLSCVDSIHKTNDGLEYEIIVSSNSQYALSEQIKLQKEHSNLIWSFNSKNGGFAYGMNRGIEKSKGEFIILQNPDTSLISENLDEALDLMRGDRTIGLIGPQILNNNGKIQDSCRPFITPFDILKRFWKRKVNGAKAILESNFEYKETQSVNWVIGAYMITSRKLINEVGMLNEKFFMYVEDMDWCFRFWEEGYKVLYYPKLKIQYEGDRKSTLGKNKFFPIPFNKYSLIHLKNYLMFLKEHGLRKINRMKVLNSA